MLQGTKRVSIATQEVLIVPCKRFQSVELEKDGFRFHPRSLLNDTCTIEEVFVLVFFAPRFLVQEMLYQQERPFSGPKDPAVHEQIRAFPPGGCQAEAIGDPNLINHPPVSPRA